MNTFVDTAQAPLIEVKTLARARDGGKQGRNQALDALRGVAILMVLLLHYGDPTYYRFALWFGWSGVDLFFVLSGFLISGLLFSEFKKTGAIDVRRFWIRRGFKIYPPFYAVIALTAIAFLIRGETVPERLLSDSFFLQSYFPSFWSHGWSLAVEEHFYFLLPLLFLGLIRLNRNNPFRFLPLLSLGLTVLCLYLRIVTCRHTLDWAKVMIPTHLRIDALFAGVALGYFNHFENASFRACRRIPMLWLAGLLVLAPAFVFPGSMFMGTVGLTFAFVGYALIVIWAVNRSQSTNLFVRLLAKIGFFSYSIYLWHRAIGVFVFDRLPQNVPMSVLYFAVTIGVGILMSKLLEIPFLKVREYYFPDSSARAAN